MAPKLRARLIPVDQGGLGGDYSLGCRAVWLTLAEQLAKPGDGPKGNTFNLLGASAGSCRVRSDIWKLESLLKEAFGLEPGTRLCLDTSVGQLEAMGSARINLVLRSEALPAARVLEKSGGVLFVYGMPYGYQGTARWLRKIGESLGQKPDAGLMERLEEKSRETARHLPVAGERGADALWETIDAYFQIIH